ncbi:hypothetical protein AB0939_15605 [Streptomyces sp. NPDC006990]|uniref:hypothetical protein n=1 Tax=unclassified Streptomyces TaxID=2593676 RepID=UPI0034568A44
MHRHVSAPARFFSQLPNDIIRHPRLSAHAVRLLAWQLSLPEGADEPLWRTAERAGIGKVAFQHAKRQLRAEQYLFEWRRQNADGRWQTVQLLTNVPLSPDEAREHAASARGVPAVARPASRPAVRPAVTAPAAGGPTRRSAAPQTLETPVGNTSHPPAPTSSHAEHQLGAASYHHAAEALLLSLARSGPHLALPPRKARQWAPLAARWLERGLGADDIRTVLTAGLERARSPLGALRWRLEHALPEPVAPVAAGRPDPGSTPLPRVSGMRECAGPHTQPLLFVPVGDEERCPACRTDAAAAAATATPSGPGLTAFRAARRALAVPPTGT